jgi:sugar lactone lactonase YvrE
MPAQNVFAIALLIGAPAVLSAGSAAYVMSTTFGNSGSIVPVDATSGAFGTAFFAPTGGGGMTVAPGTHQIWQTTSGLCYESCAPYGISVIDPQSSSTLGTIPMPTGPADCVAFDASGNYAYVSSGDNAGPGSILKIDAHSRSIVQSVGTGTSICLGIAFSADGSKLFVSFESGTMILNPQTLVTISSFSANGGLFIYGTTLLVSEYGSELLYIDTTTLTKIMEVSLPSGGGVFGISPDGSVIYVGADCGCGSYTIDELDFSSGQIILSQTYSSIGEFNTVLSSVLAPDGSQIALASNLVLLIDPSTLETTTTITPFAVPSSEVYLNPGELLLAYPNVAAMMVVDPSTAQVTASYPLGVSGGFGEVADPVNGLIYVGGGSTGYLAGSNVSVVNAASQRIVQNLLADGLAPGALAAGQVYGGPLVYNLSTGVYSSLPSPTPEGKLSWYLGGAPPDGATYWTPFRVARYNGEAEGAGVAVYNTATNTLAGDFTIPLHSYNPVVFSPDSSTAYIAEPKAIAVYNTTTLENIATYTYASTFTALAMSPGGTNLYATNGTAVIILDAATGTELHRIELPAAVSEFMALSPDGKTLILLASGSNAAELMDTGTLEVTEVALPYTPSSVVTLP